MYIYWSTWIIFFMIVYAIQRNSWQQKLHNSLNITVNMVLRLSSAVTCSRGPLLWHGFTHGPLITSKCPIRVRPDQETNMAMEGGGGVDTERGPGGV